MLHNVSPRSTRWTPRDAVVGVGATGVMLGRGVGEIRAVGVAAGVDVTYTTVTGKLVT
jgi:hypothetical protein